MKIMMSPLLACERGAAAREKARAAMELMWEAR
jgi:hypothetical protein